MRKLYILLIGLIALSCDGPEVRKERKHIDRLEIILDQYATTVHKSGHRKDLFSENKGLLNTNNIRDRVFSTMKFLDKYFQEIPEYKTFIVKKYKGSDIPMEDINGHLGFAVGMFDDDKVAIYINEEEWEEMTWYEQQMLITHELFHDLYNIEHDDPRFSFMAPQMHTDREFELYISKYMEAKDIATEFFLGDVTGKTDDEMKALLDSYDKLNIERWSITNVWVRDHLIFDKSQDYYIKKIKELGLKNKLNKL